MRARPGPLARPPGTSAWVPPSSFFLHLSLMLCCVSSFPAIGSFCFHRQKGGKEENAKSCKSLHGPETELPSLCRSVSTPPFCRHDNTPFSRVRNRGRGKPTTPMSKSWETAELRSNQLLHRTSQPTFFPPSHGPPSFSLGPPGVMKELQNSLPC